MEKGKGGNIKSMQEMSICPEPSFFHQLRTNDMDKSWEGLTVMKDNSAPSIKKDSNRCLAV